MTADDCHIILNTAPDELRRITAGHIWRQVNIGCSNACTIYLRSPADEGMYLKAIRRDTEHGLVREYEITSWLKGKLPVPDVLYYGQTEEYDYLLLTELPGAISCDERFKDNVRDVVRILAEGMRMIHSVDITDCPFDQTLDQKLNQAQYRVFHGQVDEANFEPEWIHRSAQDIFDELIAKRPNTEDVVFAHGDYCLPNVIINGSNLSGFIDLGSAGIADRYQDLSLACRSLTHNWGAEWVPHLLTEYGLPDIDEQKLEYYKLMDELF